MQNINSLGAGEARLAIDAIQTEMHTRSKAGVIAVADVHGELIGLLRLDGAPLPSIVIASNKAWTAARERKPSGDLGKSAKDPQKNFDIAYFGDNRYVGWGGGLPVVVGGTLVGAVAVSGLSEAEDVELAGIGIQAILAAL